MGRTAAPLQTAADAESEGGPSYYGIIKSYNERRGFGFVACEETARSFGRDVYLSKDEAALLAKEPVVGSSAPAPIEDGQPPLKEGDFVQFQVQRSLEGYPQAVNARRLRRLRGSVTHGTLPRDGSEGKIVVKGDGKDVEAAMPIDPEIQHLIGAEVRVRQADCGQLRLVPGDEVIFCCAAARDSDVLEAQLVELLWTSRTSGSILGCFTLELPRTLDPPADGDEQRPVAPAQAPALLDGHALVDRVLLAGLPYDLEVPELMRLFQKLGASEAVVTTSESDDADACRFASVSFSGPVEIARFLGRAAHTINEQGSTSLARLGPHREGVVVLPALPKPTLSVSEGGALMVQWTQVSLAAGYLVELRPKGTDVPWASVGVATGHLEDSAGNLPAGLLGPQCAACRVNCLSPDVPYEARVTYYTSWGCRSQASAASPACSVNGGSAAQQAPSALPAEAPAPSSPPTLPPSMEAVPPLVASPMEVPSSAALGVAASVTSGAPTVLPPAVSATPGSALEMPTSMAGGTSAASNAAAAAAAAALSAGTPGWRCAHGAVIPPPAVPELVPYEEVSRSVCIQWPTVVHATAYTVELLEEGSNSAERFTRAVPEILPEALVELRVGNLNPGAYAACVRCVAPCGCESAPSAWSFLPPLWLPPPHSTLGLGWQPGAPAEVQPISGMQGQLDGLSAMAAPHQPAYLPTQTLLATSPSLPGAPPAASATAPGGAPPTSAPPAAAPSQPPPPPTAPPAWPATTAAAAAPPTAVVAPAEVMATGAVAGVAAAPGPGPDAAPASTAEEEALVLD